MPLRAPWTSVLTWLCLATGDAVILHCQLTAIDYHSQCLGIYTVILLPLLAMFLKNDGVAPGLVAPVHTVVIACHAEVAAPAWLRAWTRNSDPVINS